MPAAMSVFLKQNLIKVKDYFLDLIFPKFCVACLADGNFLCHACQKQITWVKTQVCASCNKLSLQGKYCRECRPKHTLKGIIVAAHYEKGPIREAIHNFKYNNILELGDFFVFQMAETLKENLSPNKNFIIAPVPMHWLGKSRRGYNQAEILAREIAKNLGLACNDILRKKKGTKRQVELESRERLKNLENIFAVKKDIDLQDKKIILVDDIATTGTTMNECANA